jgi:hypothetical protein
MSVFNNCFTKGFGTYKYYHDLTKLRPFMFSYEGGNNRFAYTGNSFIDLELLLSLGIKNVKSCEIISGSYLRYITHNHFTIGYTKFGSVYLLYNIDIFFNPVQRYDIFTYTGDGYKKIKLQGLSNSISFKYIGTIGYNLYAVKSIDKLEYDFRIVFPMYYFYLKNPHGKNCQCELKGARLERIINKRFFNPFLSSELKVEPVLISLLTIPAISYEVQRELVYSTIIHRNDTLNLMYLNKIVVSYPFSFSVIKDCISEAEENPSISIKDCIWSKTKDGKYIQNLIAIYPLFKKKTLLNPKFPIPTYYPDTLIGLMSQMAINSILMSALEMSTRYQNEFTGNINLFNSCSYNNTHIAVSDVFVGFLNIGISSPLHIFTSISPNPIVIKDETKNKNENNNNENKEKEKNNKKEIFLDFVYVQIKNTDTSKRLYHNEIIYKLEDSDKGSLDISDKTTDFVIENVNSVNVEPHLYIDFPVYTKPRLISVKKHEKEPIILPEKFYSVIGYFSNFEVIINKDKENSPNNEKTLEHYGIFPINDIKIEHNGELESITNDSKSLKNKKPYITSFKPREPDIYALSEPLTQDSSYTIIEKIDNVIPIALKTQSLIRNSSNYITVFASFINCEEFEDRLIPVYLNDNPNPVYLNLCEVLLSSFMTMTTFGRYIHFCDKCNSYRSKILNLIFSYYSNKLSTESFINIIYRIGINTTLTKNKNKNNKNSIHSINFSLTNGTLVDAFTTKFPILNVGIEQDDTLRIITPDYKEITYVFNEDIIIDKKVNNLLENSPNAKNIDKKSLKEFLDTYPLLWVTYEENIFDLLS